MATFCFFSKSIKINKQLKTQNIKKYLKLLLLLCPVNSSFGIIVVAIGVILRIFLQTASFNNFVFLFLFSRFLLLFPTRTLVELLSLLALQAHQRRHQLLRVVPEGSTLQISYNLLCTVIFCTLLGLGPL
jgi:hypothetical protein